MPKRSNVDDVRDNTSILQSRKDSEKLNSKVDKTVEDLKSNKSENVTLKQTITVQKIKLDE